MRRIPAGAAFLASSRRVLAIAAAAVAPWLAAGCLPPYVIPDALDRQVDRTVDFAQLRLDPERFKGSVVALGGTVLNARDLREGTEIELLQAPLDDADRPMSVPVSGGRFLLLDPERSDPAVLAGHTVTLVGEVLGTKDLGTEDHPDLLPYLRSRFLHVWLNTGEYAYEPPYTDPTGAYPSYPYFDVDPYPFWSTPSWYYVPPPVAAPRQQAPQRPEPPPGSTHSPAGEGGNPRF